MADRELGEQKARVESRAAPMKKMLKETHQPQKNLLVTTLQPKLLGHFMEHRLESPQGT